MIVNKLKQKIISKLEDPNHVIVLNNEQDAMIFEVDLDTLNRAIKELIQDSSCVASGSSESSTFGIPDSKTLYLNGKTYFTFSGGGMDAEVIEGCTKDQAEKLLTLWGES
tara:strand:+ start:3553 stop:3882 length:330 start_codon:yes stop_codon:yes gene_type:complete